jgi:hypothetical protein
MSETLEFEAPAHDGVSRRARLVLAIMSVIVMLLVVGVVEVATLAAVTVVSSGRNHR